MEYVAAAALLLAAAVVLYNRRRTARLLRRLDEMVARAMDGSFSDEHFDESRLSSLESRMRQYLLANTSSARQLQAQKNRISGLISDVSHQTKTPVANLKLYAELLAEQPLTPQGQACVQNIQTQAEKLQALMEALVKTSRLETGLLTLHPVEGAVAPVVERAVAQYGPEADRKGIALRWDCTEETAVFDPKWTEEAVCNLLDNALKYTPSGGSVSVEMRSFPLFCAVRVTDTGPGLPEAEQARIFNRFYRANGAYQAEGVGLGLYLTRQIAENQGGYVKVNSVPGQGSTFSLYLPRA